MMQKYWRFRTILNFFPYFYIQIYKIRCTVLFIYTKKKFARKIFLIFINIECAFGILKSSSECLKFLSLRIFFLFYKLSDFTFAQCGQVMSHITKKSGPITPLNCLTWDSKTSSKRLHNFHEKWCNSVRPLVIIPTKPLNRGHGNRIFHW